MRIAYIHPDPVPGREPPALQVLQTVDGLAQNGIEVDLITPEPPFYRRPEQILGRPLAAGATVRHLTDFRRRWFFPFSSSKVFCLQARRVLQGNNYQAVLVRNLKLADRLLAMRLPVPIYFETHEIFAQSYLETYGSSSRAHRNRHKQIQFTESRVYARAHGIFALTASLVEDLRSSYGVRTPCWVVPDGVDLDASRLACRARRPGRPVRLLYLGSLHPWKGVPTAIRAMTEIGGAELWIAGGQSERLRNLKALVSELKIEHKVRFLGWVEPLGRFDIIDQCDICLLPLAETSIGGRYTSPLKLFEYMAMGKPIVASSLPSVHEVLDPDRFGDLLVEPIDPHNFARCINALIAQPRRMAAVGGELAELAQHYSWTERSRRMAEACMRDHAARAVPIC